MIETNYQCYVYTLHSLIKVEQIYDVTFMMNVQRNCGCDGGYQAYKKNCIAMKKMRMKRKL